MSQDPEKKRGKSIWNAGRGRGAGRGSCQCKDPVEGMCLLDVFRSQQGSLEAGGE